MLQEAALKHPIVVQKVLPGLQATFLQSHVTLESPVIRPLYGGSVDTLPQVWKLMILEVLHLLPQDCKFVRHLLCHYMEVGLLWMTLPHGF